MKRDDVVLGEGCILRGDEVGKTRPNANVLVQGTTGSGKSKSLVLPTIARCEFSNPVLSFAKEPDAYAMSLWLEERGYTVYVLNIAHPKQSNISYDPILSLESYEDISQLSSAIVDETIKKSADDYWEAKAKSLLGGLIAAELMISGPKAGMIDVLDRFDSLLPKGETDNGAITTDLDDLFRKIRKAAPHCYAIREFSAWRTLPYRTGSCVRDTLAASLSTVFPESIRKMMRDKPQFSAEKFANQKAALIIITSAIDTAQQYYANLFYRDVVRQLLRYAARCPDGELPREVRLIFDDFACTCPIKGFANDISLFRSAGLSAILLLQSEQQLEAIYKEDAPIIRQNCAAYAFFPGGFDDRSCAIVSRQMGLPYDEVLYASLGKVFIMQSGKKPCQVPRYDILHSPEYKEYQNAFRKANSRAAQEARRHTTERS